jgi:hypothetical protein
MTDPNTNTSSNIHTYIYTEHVSKNGTAIRDKGRKERRRK